jgi:hypothetical protein
VIPENDVVDDNPRVRTSAQSALGDIISLTPTEPIIVGTEEEEELRVG